MRKVDLGAPNDHVCRGSTDTDPRQFLEHEFGEPFEFGHGGNGCALLRTGFSAPEPWGTWTVQPRAVMEIPAPAGENLFLWLEFQVYSNQANAPAGFRLYANGREVGAFRVITSKWGSRYRREFRIPPAITNGGFLRIEFDIFNSCDPAVSGISDPRPIGVGLYRVGFSRISSGSNPEIPEELRHPRLGSLKLYAILSTPRSGSTYFAQILESAGIGSPREHLQNDVINEIISNQPSAAAAAATLRELFLKNQQSGAFGSQITSQYLFNLLGYWRIPEVVSEFLLSRSRVLYLVRRDKVGQALSYYLAERSGIWHARSDSEVRRLGDSHQTISYDFDAILGLYRQMHEHERRLATHVRLTEHRVFYYEDVALSAADAVKAAAEFLGLMDFGPPSPDLRVLRGNATEVLRGRFLADFRARFNEDPSEYVA